MQEISAKKRAVEKIDLHGTAYHWLSHHYPLRFRRSPPTIHRPPRSLCDARGPLYYRLALDGDQWRKHASFMSVTKRPRMMFSSFVLTSHYYLIKGDGKTGGCFHLLLPAVVVTGPTVFKHKLREDLLPRVEAMYLKIELTSSVS